MGAAEEELGVESEMTKREGATATTGKITERDLNPAWKKKENLALRKKPRTRMKEQQ